MSWTYELQVHGGGDKWHAVNVFYASEEEARRAGGDKYSAWTMCKDYRVVMSDQPVNVGRSPGELAENDDAAQ